MHELTDGRDWLEFQLMGSREKESEREGEKDKVYTTLPSCVFFSAYRDVRSGLGAIAKKSKMLVLAVEGAQSLGPDRRDGLLVLQMPVEIKDPVQVHSQTFAFVNDDAELLQLPHSRGFKIISTKWLNKSLLGFNLAD